MTWAEEPAGRRGRPTNGAGGWVEDRAEHRWHNREGADAGRKGGRTATYLLGNDGKGRSDADERSRTFAPGSLNAAGICERA